MRRRVTEVFPFLLPLRKWQRKTFFYLKIRFDGNDYASRKTVARLRKKVASARTRLINKNTGHDIVYQYNKVHNLKLAVRAINGLLIFPKQSFSFWQCVRHADRVPSYKEGLVVINGKISTAKGGGLCQLSSMLYRLLSQTNLSLVERHSHEGESLPLNPDDDETPPDSDATVSEGWLDLRFKNETPFTYQLDFSFDDEYLYGTVFSDEPCYEELCYEEA